MLSMQLENGGSMTIPDLTKKLCLSRQAVALTTRNFEKRGLASREGTKEDLRKMKVTLAEKGIELIRKIGLSDHRKETHSTLMSFVSEKEARQLATTLTKLTNKLRRTKFNE